MDIITPEWKGNPKDFAEQLYQVICTALKKQLANSPREQHVRLIREASEAFNIRLHAKSYDFAKNPAGKEVIDDLQNDYAQMFAELEMDMKA